MSQVHLGALRLPAEVIAAAGSLGYGAGPLPAAAGEPEDAAAPDTLGAAITSGISWRSRAGRAPRLTETAAGVVYTPGRAALGVDVALLRYARLWASAPYPVIVNLKGATAGDFALAAGELEGVPGIRALELDLTAPDDETGVPFGFDPLALRRIVGDVRRVCDLPVLVKLPAHAPDMDATLQGAAAARVSAATLAAGLPAVGGWSGRGRRRQYPEGAGQDETAEQSVSEGGRLVGPATFPVILELVAGLAPGAPLPIVACGGVVGPAQASAYLRAGAVAVQVGSAHLASPRAAADLQRALR